MRKRLRKWLGITALALKYVALLKRVEALEGRHHTLRVSFDNLERRFMELDGRLPARPEPKSQPLQMKNWREFIDTIEQGREISA